MAVETYTPTFANLEDLQVLFKTMGDTAGAALDKCELQNSALWLITKLSDTAVRDIERLLKKELGHAA